MKKVILPILTGALLSVNAMAQQTAPEVADLSGVLTDNSFSWDLTFPGEPGVKGCVGDFNEDGIDDFILTGLYSEGETTKSFLRVYLCQSAGDPVLAYSNLEFTKGGNGAIDCYKKADGSWIVAIQGGNSGNWTNPFTAATYKLTVEGTTANMELVNDLDFGAGRGAILLFDADGDGNPDIFQNGWVGNQDWTDQANLYLNDGDDWFMLQDESGIVKASNLFTTKADINGDGKMDLAFATQGTDGVAYVYLNNGDGTFREIQVAKYDQDAVGGAIHSEDDNHQLLLIDFNNDGKLDIVLNHVLETEPWSYMMRLFQNNGDDTFTEIQNTNGKGETVSFVGGQRPDYAVGDFNGDGNMDFIMGAENNVSSGSTWGCYTYIFYGNGKGGFDQKDITATGLNAMCRRGNFGRYLTGDFNGDGKTDVITAGTNYYAKNPGVQLFLNVSEGTGTGVENTLANDKVSVCVAGNQITVIGAANGSCAVYSIGGQKIAENMLVSNMENFSIDAQGIYILKVTTADGVKTQKVIIK